MMNTQKILTAEEIEALSKRAIDYIDNSSLQIDNIDDTVKVLTKI